MPLEKFKNSYLKASVNEIFICTKNIDVHLITSCSYAKFLLLFNKKHFCFIHLLLSIFYFYYIFFHIFA